MRRPQPTRRTTLACLASLAAPSLPTYAQTPEGGLLRIVVPVSPGGAADSVARMIAPLLAEKLHLTAVIDNRPGAATQIGAQAVVQAKPDGNTLLFTSDATTVINPYLYEKLRYAPADLVPITLAVKTPFVLVASSAFPARSLRQSIELAKQRNGAVSYASIGVGSPQHLCMERLAKRAGIALNHIPYNGGGAALSAVAGGQVDLMLASIGGAKPHLDSGKYHALGFGAGARSSLLPDVPTIAEQGFEGYEGGTWLGFYGPAQLQAATARRIQRAVREVIEQPATRERLRAIGADAVGSTPEEFAALSLREAGAWRQFIREAGIKVE